MAKKTPSNLLLKVVTEWETYSKELSPAQSLVFGRSPEADIPIPRDSVSGEHLSLTWTGESVLIADLNSDNGTFRLPQEAPFMEAKFGSVEKELRFRLSKSEIVLEWKPVVATVAAKNSSAAKRAASHRGALSGRGGDSQTPRGEPSVAAPKKDFKHLPDHPVQLQHTRKPIGGQTRIGVVESAAASKWLATSVFLFSCCLLSIGLGLTTLRPLLNAPAKVLRSGGWLDVCIVWTGLFYNSRLFVILVAVGILMGALGTHKIGLARAQLAKWQLAPVFSFKMLSVIFLALTFAWPFALMKWHQQSLASISSARKFWNLKRHPLKTPGETVVALKTLLPDLLGSSFLYKELLLSQRARVLDECEARNENTDWESEKLCLILLGAVGIETFGDVRPALLGDIAARTAILMNVDGLSRIVATDGRDNSSVLFFINSLDSIGLGPEAAEIQEMVNNKDRSDSEVAEGLIELRKKMEAIIELRFRELRYSRLFHFTVPGPLESGI